MSVTSHIAYYYSDDEDDDDLTEEFKPDDRRVGAGHGSGQSRPKPLIGDPYLLPAGRGRGRGSSRPFRPSPLALYCSPEPSPVLPKARPKFNPSSGSSFRETIRQLEKVAQEVKLMGGKPRGRGKPRAPSPPPAIPPRNPMRVMARPRTPSPTRPPASSDSSDSGSSYSSPSSSPASSPDLSDPFHAPILKGDIPPGWLMARMSQLRLSATLAAQQPQIKLTAPSQESLSRRRLEPVLERNPRWAGLWDGEPDEIQWIEEYGQWSDADIEQPQDELGVASDYESDEHSVVSSIFTTIPDTSSMSTSPPTSPTKARQSPVYHDLSYPLIPQRSPTRPLTVVHKPEPMAKRPVTWLKRTISKKSMLSVQEVDEQEKPREGRKLKKQPSPTLIPSPYVRLVEGGYAWGDRPWYGEGELSADTQGHGLSPTLSDATYMAPSPVPTQTALSEHSNGSSWSVDSEKPQKGWGSWFKRGRAGSRVKA